MAHPSVTPFSGYSGDLDELGAPHGNGRLRRAATRPGDGPYLYSGGWVHGAYGGRGVEVLENGDRYDGSFIGGAREGEGRAVYRPGSRPDGVAQYSGGWRRGKWQGAGKLTYPCGDVFRGNFSDGVASGEGAMRYARGGSFSGLLVRGRRQGLGRRVWGTSGCASAEFEGEWVDGAMCGKGVYRSAGGSLVIGHWKDDLPHGEATVMYAEGGGMYQGTLVRGRFCGTGRHTLPHGRGFYEGQYLALLRTGLPWAPRGAPLRGRARHAPRGRVLIGSPEDEALAAAERVGDTPQSPPALAADGERHGV